MPPATRSVTIRRVIGLAALWVGLAGGGCGEAPDGAAAQAPAGAVGGKADFAGSDRLECLGESLPLLGPGLLPFVPVTLDGRPGAFLVDFASTFSSVDPAGFEGGLPGPSPGSDFYGALDFFGPWGPVRLVTNDYSGIGGPVRQAGILGTDFLAHDVFTLDFARRELRRAHPGQSCDEPTLLAAGLRPLSTRGYYARDVTTLPPGVPNVPAVPVRIGAAVAQAQLDTGYDDALVGPALNVNRSFLEQITATTALQRAPELDLALSTCVFGVTENILAHRLPAAAPLELVGEDGGAVRTVPEAIVFLKDTPAAAFSCGGIGTQLAPAAQLGLKAMFEAGRMLLDPVEGRVWLQGPASE